AINIPMPFGGTPLHEQLLADGRVLGTMPFGFYYTPYLVTIPLHYHPVTYYQKLLELFSHATSRTMLASRLGRTANRRVRLIHRIRTAGTRAMMKSHRQILDLLRCDPAFRAFHEGRSATLPDFYHHRYEQMLGPYAPLVSRSDRMPLVHSAREMT